MGSAGLILNINMSSNFYQQSTLNKSRTDKFRMVFTIPAALRKINRKQERSNFTIKEDTMQLSIYGTIVPEIIVPALLIRYAGSTLYNSSHSREPYPAVTVKFTIDNEYNNYWVIYKWLNLLHDEKTGTFDKTNLISDDVFLDYQSNISIYGLDEYENNRIKFTYTKAFPTAIGGVTYDYRDGAEIQSSFTFVYSQLHTELLST